MFLSLWGAMACKSGIRGPGERTLGLEPGDERSSPNLATHSSIMESWGDLSAFLGFHYPTGCHGMQWAQCGMLCFSLGECRRKPRAGASRARSAVWPHSPCLPPPVSSISSPPAGAEDASSLSSLSWLRPTSFDTNPALIKKRKKKKIKRIAI